MDKIDPKAKMPSHTSGTPRGEELVHRKGREPGRNSWWHQRTARDSTSVCPKAREPIDRRMPHMPPP